MRIVFFGTPDFAVPTLTELVGQGHDVVAVFTQPPRGAGRGMDLRKSPVHEVAERFAIPIHTPVSLKLEAETIRSLDADVGVVVAYGLLLPKNVLDAPEHGCLNLHASLLPRWRGAAPIARAIMAGDTETGVMVMRMDEGLDTGPVAMAERVAIPSGTTAGDLHDRLSLLGADLMVRAIAALSRDGLTFEPQAGDGATYAKKLQKSESRIDWSRPATDVLNHIHGLSPVPGAWFEAKLGRKPERIRVLKAETTDGSGEPGTILDDTFTIACGQGAVRPTEIQRAGKSPMGTDVFLRGVRELPESLA